MTEILLRGVMLSRVNRQHLTKAVKAINLQTDTSVDSMVASLGDHLIRLHKQEPDKLLGCDYCGGASDATFDVCPYCGKNDDEATAAANAANAAAPSAPSTESVVNARPAKTPRSKAVKATPPEKPAKVAAAKAPKAPKADKLAVAHTAELVTTKALDDKIAEIDKVQVNIVENHWLLGQLLGETFDLYKLRPGADGATPKYKNWGQFVASELKFTPQYAYELVAVSRAFTQDDIREVGVTKLRVIARIPDEAKRENLLARAKQQLNGKPMPRTELEQEAKLLGTTTRASSPGMQSKGGEAAAEKRANAAKERAKTKGVTAIIQPGLINIPLFSSKVSKKKEPARAFELADEPHAVEDLLNGIKVHYRLVKEADGLVLVVERVREG